MSENLGSIYAEVRLALDKLDGDMRELRTTMKEAQNTIESATEDASKKTELMSKQTADAFNKVGKTATVAGLAIAGGLGVAVNKYMDFEAMMSRVGALSGATADEMDALTASAKELGATTKFTATEAAEGMSYLAMAGYEANDVIAAMPGLLSAAAAGQTDLGTTADIVSNILSGFGMEASETSKAADVLTAAFTSSNTDLRMLGDSMKYVAPIASTLGISLEETAAAVGILGNAGIQGSKAGTVLRGAFTRLVKPTAQAAEMMDELGLNVIDAEGKLVPMPELLDQLSRGLEGMGEAQQAAALSTIFGAEAMAGISVLLEEGGDSLAAYTEELENAGGTADRIADQQLDNLAGSMTLLSSAVDGAMMSFGEALAPAIRSVAEAITGLVTWFNNLDESTKQTIAKAIAVTGAILLIAGPILMLISWIPKLMAGFAALKTVFLAVKGAVLVVTGALSWPVVAIAAIVAAVVALGVIIYKNWNSIKEWTINAWNSIVDFFKGIWDWIVNFFSKWGIEILAVIMPFIGIPLLIWKHWDEIKELLAEVWDGIVAFFTETIPAFVQNVITWFAELPAKIGEFLYDLAFVKIPYYIGYAMGTLVRLIVEGWNAAVEFIVNMVTVVIPETLANFGQAVADFFTWLWDKVVELVKSLVDGVIWWFTEMPKIVVEKVKQFLAMLVQKFIEIRQAVVEQVREMITSVIQFFKDLPGKVAQTAVNLFNAARNLGKQIWDGLIGFIADLPRKVLDIFKNVIKNITNLASTAWNAAKEFAGNMWSGFKKGLGISSPSYLEEAMFDIVDTGKWMLDSMKSDFRTLGNIKVNPSFAFAGAVTGPTAQVVRHDHTGVLEIRGTNDEGQFVDAVRVVMDELRREVRT